MICCRFGVVLAAALTIAGCVTDTPAPVSTAAPPQPAVASSAYDGAVGDWALGKWTGLAITVDRERAALQRVEGYLLFARDADERVTCKYKSGSGEASFVSCQITASTIASTISARAASGGYVSLQRDGDNRMTGTWMLPGGIRSAPVSLTRTG